MGTVNILSVGGIITIVNKETNIHENGDFQVYLSKAATEILEHIFVKEYLDTASIQKPYHTMFKNQIKALTGQVSWLTIYMEYGQETSRACFIFRIYIAHINTSF